MLFPWLRIPERFILLIGLLSLVVIVACGSSATATPGASVSSSGSGTSPSRPTGPTAVPNSGTSAPAPTPIPTEVPQAEAKPSGTLNIGQKELGPYQGHPKLAGNPQIFLNQVISAENLVMHSSESSSEFLPMLAESWSLSDDNLSWTFKIRKGIQFHQGFGELTAEDVLWSFDQIIESAKHPGSSDVARMWQHEAGFRETPDPYTIVLNTGIPAIDVLNRIRNPWAGSTWVASKKQSDELGEEEANDRTALPGHGNSLRQRPPNTGSSSQRRATGGKHRPLKS